MIIAAKLQHNNTNNMHVYMIIAHSFVELLLPEV